MEQNVLTYDSREWEREEMGIIDGNVMGMGMTQQNKWYREWDWEWLHGNGREWNSERHSRSPLVTTPTTTTMNGTDVSVGDVPAHHVGGWSSSLAFSRPWTTRRTSLQADDCWRKGIFLCWSIYVEQSSTISARRNAILGILQAFAQMFSVCYLLTTDTAHGVHYRFVYLNDSALYKLSLIHIWRCRRIERCRSRWSPYH